MSSKLQFFIIFTIFIIFLIFVFPSRIEASCTLWNSGPIGGDPCSSGADCNPWCDIPPDYACNGREYTWKFVGTGVCLGTLCEYKEYKCDCPHGCGGGDGGGTPDTTNPKCGVRIEPYVASGNLIQNGDFETRDLSFWSVVSGGPSVRTGNGLFDYYTEPDYVVYGSNYAIEQTINVEQGAIYSVSFWARARHYNQGGEECWGISQVMNDPYPNPSPDIMGKIMLARGKYNSNWVQFNSTFRAQDGQMTIRLIGDRAGDACWYDQVAFDDVVVKKLEGATSASGSNVSLKIGVWDNRSELSGYRIKNSDNPTWPGWTDIPWVHENKYEFFANPISNWPLSGNGVDVQIKDGAGNESDVCSDTIAPPTGQINGWVYKNMGGSCVGTDSSADVNWQVDCKIGENWIPAYRAVASPSQYVCCKSWTGSSCDTFQLPQNQTYLIRLTPPADWLVVSETGCPTNPQSIYLDSSAKIASNFYIWQGADPWFQTQGGDVHGQTGIRSKIPTTATDKNFSMVLNNYPGVVSHTGTADFSPGGTVSSKGWLANSSTLLSYNFDYFYNLLDSPTENWPTGNADDFPVNPGTGETEIVYTTRPAHLPGFANLSGRKIIVLTSSNALIENNITLANDGFLAVIAAQHINISDSVSRVQGVYIAGSVTSPTSHISTGTGTVQFEGQGIFYAPSIELRRDLDPDKTTNANIEPAETFIFRPDLVINTPKELRRSQMSWQEVAP